MSVNYNNIIYNIINKEKVFIDIVMVMFIWDNGNKINFMVMEYIYLQMVKVFKVFFKIIKVQMEYIHI